MTTKKVSELPKRIKGWFERELKRAFRPTERVTFYGVPSRRSIAQRSKKWDAERARRDRRLRLIAGRMRRKGMKQADIDCILRGGWD